MLVCVCVCVWEAGGGGEGVGEVMWTRAAVQDAHVRLCCSLCLSSAGVGTATCLVMTVSYTDVPTAFKDP